MTDQEALVERVADAIERAQCFGREGPFGGYDYGHNEDFYGPAPEEGRYVIRDFREPSSPNWGKWLHNTNDLDEHERLFAKMTRDHVARAALATIQPEIDALRAELAAVDSECLIVNCRRKAPDDEAFCAKHRKDNATIAANLEAAQTVIAEQLEIRQRLEEERATHLEAITNLGAIITRLRKRAITHVCQPDDQVMVDAARYRWLRDHSCPPHNFYISVPDEFSGVHYTPAEVDDYIDAALAKQESSHDNRR